MLEIAKKYPRRSELLQHILQPSLKIEDKFATYAVVTNAGRVLTGLLVEKTDQQLILKTAEKRIVRVAIGEIDEMRTSKLSLMPAQILSDLTAQEAADLVAFLLSLRPDEAAN